jgi:hypothetical protein
LPDGRIFYWNQALSAQAWPYRQLVHEPAHVKRPIMQSGGENGVRESFWVSSFQRPVFFDRPVSPPAGLSEPNLVSCEQRDYAGMVLHDWPEIGCP